MKHQKLIDRITEIAEADGWSVSVEERKDREDTLEFTFGKYTDADQDFSFYVEMTDGDIYTLIEDINRYYEGTAVRNSVLTNIGLLMYFCG